MTDAAPTAVRRARSGRPPTAQVAKIIAAGLSATAVLGLTTAYGWSARAATNEQAPIVPSAAPEATPAPAAQIAAPPEAAPAAAAAAAAPAAAPAAAATPAPVAAAPIPIPVAVPAPAVAAHQAAAAHQAPVAASSGS